MGGLLFIAMTIMLEKTHHGKSIILLLYIRISPKMYGYLPTIESNFSGISPIVDVGKHTFKVIM